MDTIDLNKVKTAYFIGIGGIGISAIARMLLLRGVKVYGSDRDASRVTDELKRADATIFIGQSKENIMGVKDAIDLFVYTVAMPEDSPEIIEAKSRGVSVLTYPQMLGVVSKDTFTIAVSGTHGKTTTTAMIAKILIDAGLDPTVIVGSMLHGSKSNFIAGKSKYLIVEADEYKKSFHNLHPSILVINNLDEDHLDFYKDLADIQDSFSFVAKRVPKTGFIITNTENPNVTPVIREVEATIIPYQEETLTAKLKVPGDHNRSNAKAALSVAKVLGIDSKKAQESLAEFSGVWRRFEYKGTTKDGVIVYDDYAHNPQKTQALLQGAREYFGDKKIVTVFQPHLFSRTKTLFDSFVKSFDNTDVLIFAPIYAAREVFDPTISSEMLAEALKKAGKKEVYAFKNFDEIAQFLKTYLKKDNVLITVGAGEAYKVGETLLS